MKSSQNIQRLGHTKFTSCSSDFELKTLERAIDLKGVRRNTAKDLLSALRAIQVH